MTESEQAILDHLVTEPGQLQRRGPETPSGWVFGGEGADPATVRFRRCREFPDCQLHAVSFSTRDGHPRESVLRTVRERNGGWSIHPIGGGGEGHPAHSRPYVNLTAQWNNDMFAGGGDVIGNDADQAHLVRLAFADQTTVDDVPHDGVVLFYVAHGVAFPAQVEILDETGAALAAYDEFAYLA
jgi:hypothetical protein